jgi:hypothetical protein
LGNIGKERSRWRGYFRDETIGTPIVEEAKRLLGVLEDLM